MEVLIKVVQFFLSLSILIILHEFGHYATARLFKIKVEKFYLFFDPWFSLFKFKRGDTEYGIGWLPLGGYVKIAGMIDESMDKEQMKKPPQPWEFRTKPAWQRLTVMVAGVVMNILLAISIYVLMLFFIGESYLPTKNVKHGIVVDSAGYDIGLRNGDKILSVDYDYIENFREIPLAIILNTAESIQVKRNNDTIDIAIPPGFIGGLIKNKNVEFLSVRTPSVVGGLMEGHIAESAGIKANDLIIAINNTTIDFFDELVEKVQKNKGEEIFVSVLRNERVVDLELMVPEDGILGIYAMGPAQFLDFATREYNFWQAIPAGVNKTYNTTVDYIKQFKLLFTSKEVKATESLGGFITIGGIFPAKWDWVHFWSITAFLSVILAFMNILPIPALDGGHVMFLLYEVVTRRKPNEKVMEYAQYAGLIILLSLLLFVNINDVVRLFR